MQQRISLSTQNSNLIYTINNSMLYHQARKDLKLEINSLPIKQSVQTIQRLVPQPLPVTTYLKTRFPVNVNFTSPNVFRLTGN